MEASQGAVEERQSTVNENLIDKANNLQLMHSENIQSLTYLQLLSR